MITPAPARSRLVGATRRAVMLFALGVSVAHAQSAGQPCGRIHPDATGHSDRSIPSRWRHRCGRAGGRRAALTALGPADDCGQPGRRAG